MLKTRMAVAQRLAKQLFSAENSIDTSIQRAARMIGELPAARKRANLSATFGQEAYQHAQAMQTALVEARRHAVALHGSLDLAREQIGLRTRSFGDLADKPDPGIPPSGVLTVVESTRPRRAA